MKRQACLFAAVLGLSAMAHATSIVAAESFYGDVARQIAGPGATITSVLANPDQDPHLFEAGPSVARAVARADIVVYNGLDYDPWMARLLASSPEPARQVLVAAVLAGAKPGDNPHVWYDLATMRALAVGLAAALTAQDPSHAQDYRERLAAFEASLVPLQARIAAMRARVGGTQVTATEPLADDLLQALGLVVRDRLFQRAVMNATEPAASGVARFEDGLRSHQVRLLLYNSQATDPIADRMLGIAHAANVPTVAATESEPAGLSYQAWMASLLDLLQAALVAPRQ